MDNTYKAFVKTEEASSNDESLAESTNSTASSDMETSPQKSYNKPCPRSRKSRTALEMQDSSDSDTSLSSSFSESIERTIASVMKGELNNFSFSDLNSSGSSFTVSTPDKKGKRGRKISSPSEESHNHSLEFKTPTKPPPKKRKMLKDHSDESSANEKESIKSPCRKSPSPKKNEANRQSGRTKFPQRSKDRKKDLMLDMPSANPASRDNFLQSKKIAIKSPRKKTVRWEGN